MCILCQMAELEPSLQPQVDEAHACAELMGMTLKMNGKKASDLILAHGAATVMGLRSDDAEMVDAAKLFIRNMLMPVLYAGFESEIMQQMAAANSYVNMIKMDVKGVA